MGIRDIFLFQDIIKRHGKNASLLGAIRILFRSGWIRFDSFGFAAVPWVNWYSCHCCNDFCFLRQASRSGDCRVPCILAHPACGLAFFLAENRILN